MGQIQVLSVSFSNFLNNKPFLICIENIFWWILIWIANKSNDIMLKNCCYSINDIRILLTNLDLFNITIIYFKRILIYCERILIWIEVIMLNKSDDIMLNKLLNCKYILMDCKIYLNHWFNNNNLFNIISFDLFNIIIIYF